MPDIKKGIYQINTKKEKDLLSLESLTVSAVLMTSTKAWSS